MREQIGLIARYVGKGLSQADDKGSSRSIVPVLVPLIEAVKELNTAGGGEVQRRTADGTTWNGESPPWTAAGIEKRRTEGCIKSETPDALYEAGRFGQKRGNSYTDMKGSSHTPSLD
ncbi:hypothetical protein [Bradyrhizobium pachyrhizi]|uniref:hypothetical protein n=1 Tax=Bradyrhizobium pachyrhizi TaxID=280333 RepID=UPI00128ED796|nr:hypothetical protein [Bradyrhizobium pachyrhizi]